MVYSNTYGSSSIRAHIGKYPDGIQQKDIFEFCYPSGWVPNGAVALNDDELLTDTDNTGDTDTEKKAKRKPSDQKYMAVCEKCDHPTYSEVKTRYGNAVVHAKSCHKIENIIDAIQQARAAINANGDDMTANKKVEKNLFAAMSSANEQDVSIHSLIKVVVLHNIAISKATRDKDFQSHLKIHDRPISYEVLVNAMIQLFVYCRGEDCRGNKGK